MFTNLKINRGMYYRDYLFALAIFICSWFFTVHLFSVTAKNMEIKYEELEGIYSKKLSQMNQDLAKATAVVEKNKQNIMRITNDINLNSPKYPFLWHVQQTNCAKMERVGSIVDYYRICHDVLNLTSSSIVYSFGVSDDLSLEMGLINTYGVHVYAFGLSDEIAVFIEQEKMNGHISENLHFYPWGIWYFDGFLPMTTGRNKKFSIINRDETHSTGNYQRKQVFTLHTLMRKLGHNTISILKLDVDGAEYEVLNSLLYDASAVDIKEKSNIIPVSQVLVQFNEIAFDPKYGFGVSAPDINKIIQRMNAVGLYTFNLEPYNVKDKSRRMGFTRTKEKTTPLITTGTHQIQHI